jgi:hypothetical protein
VTGPRHSKTLVNAVTHRALAHAKQRAALAHASADMNIDRMRLGHECVYLLVALVNWNTPVRRLPMQLNQLEWKA